MIKRISRPAIKALMVSMCCAATSFSVAANDTPNAWKQFSGSEKKQAEAYATQYKDFIHKARTELTFVTEAVKLAESKGFKRLTDSSPLTPGARYYDVNRDRAMTMMVIGEQPLEAGFRVAGSHIDSPRIELKGRPLYEKQGFALFQTYVHGGIKNYQWVNVPLALIGRVDKTDGTHVNINIGLDPADPVLIVPDLAPHVDHSMRKRTNRDVIKKEELDVIVANTPGRKDAVKDTVVRFLKDEYDISIADLVSAELALVPAMAPRDVGFDRSMVVAYGQDDKVAAYASVAGLFDLKKPKYTAMAFLVDNEEVGNINNTGAESTYLVDLMADLLYRDKGSEYSDYWLRKALRNTKVVSVDVNPGVNPSWSGVWELGNAPRLGHGINIKLYGGGFNANSEYVAWTRAYLDDNDIPWQTSTYKGKASGGTIGSDLSRNNMEVIDFGIPVLSIHSPYAVASKADMFLLYKAMRSFYQR